MNFLKKNQLKNYLLTLTLIFGVSVLLLNCEKENFNETSQSIEKENSYKVKTVKLSEIPEIRDFLVDKTNDNIFKSSEINGAIFDEDNIMEVIDTLNRTNYSFRFSYPNTPMGTFYNLVVGKTSEGETKTPIVIKYTCDEMYLDEFIANNFNFQFFKGKVILHKYTDFFEVGNILKSDTYCPPEYDEFGDPIPCDIISADGGSSSSGGGEVGDPGSTGDTGSTESTSDTGSGGSESYSCTYVTETERYRCNTFYGDNYWCSRTVSFWDCSSPQKSFSTKAEGDCPECPKPDGVIGVVTVSIESARIALKYNLNLNGEQLNWIGNLDNNNEVISIYNFLESNTDFNDDYTQEAISFAKAAIDALMNDGEVDFNNEIIKDSSFIGTKADCVLNDLINSGNNLFKISSQAFTGGRSEFKIKFTTYNNSSDPAIARTGLPDSNGIISIRFNLLNINATSISLAGSILHETIHAELHRIKISNNAGPNPLPIERYNWYVQMWNIFGNGDINRAATGAEHSYMAQYFIDPIASGLREFDENTHSLENYKYFAWTGLEERGKLNEYITQSELTNLANLSQIVTNDTHANPCD